MKNKKKIPWYLPQTRLFDDYYLKIYEEKIITAERTKSEVNFIDKIIGTKSGMEILDLACGPGRHAIELAKRGYRVTAQDINPRFLEIARNRASKAGVEIQWIRKDMREIPFERKFDAVINIFTAFGYFDREEENHKVIFQIAKALKKGGIFLLDTNNPYSLIAKFQPRDFFKSESGYIFISERNFDFMKGRINERRAFFTDTGEKKLNELSIRLYTLPELISMCKKAGLEYKKCYKDYQEKPIDMETNRWILITEKK